MISIPSLSLWAIGAWFRKSLLAQIGAGVLAFMTVWKINNIVVARQTVKKVVKASQKAGQKRNDQTSKIRARIKPSTAMQRLRRQYANGN